MCYRCDSALAWVQREDQLGALQPDAGQYIGQLSLSNRRPSVGRGRISTCRTIPPNNIPLHPEPWLHPSTRHASGRVRTIHLCLVYSQGSGVWFRGDANVQASSITERVKCAWPLSSCPSGRGRESSVAFDIGMLLSHTAGETINWRAFRPRLSNAHNTSTIQMQNLTSVVFI